MRKVLVSLFLGVLFLVFAANNSYAEKCRCMDKMGGDMHEEDMPMMGEMKHQGMEMGDEHRMWRHLKSLGLDEKQREAIKEIKSRVMKDTIGKRAELKIAEIELKDILDKDTVDMNAAEAKLKQIESLKTDIHLSHIKAMEEIKAKLTPEQQKQFKMDLKKHGKSMHGGGKGMTPPSKKKE